MTEPSELVERLAAVVDPRYSAEFVGNIVRANWPDIHAALSDPLAMAKAMQEAAARAAYVACAETRHVTLGDKCAEAILAIGPATLEVNHATD